MNTQEQAASVSGYIACVSDLTREIEVFKTTHDGTISDCKALIGMLTAVALALEEAIETHPTVGIFDQLLYKFCGLLVDAVCEFKALEAALLAEASRATIH
jgi:hypothetical protein